ncbi:MAG: phosphoribosylformylglycinamidine cyclo-ligase [Kiritimatiellae bacterium]|jgi:phosphoribosylformylglycinamidine cyclo-ligase|nr:phosphoribosylformylglycinamidine cyclo-ligase [Kiritimatiellia bacterium]
MKKKAVVKKKKSAYANAGVDIDSKMNGIQSIKKMVAATQTEGVIGGIGSFGGLFESPGRDHMLVSSADGVGTKLKVACMANKHDTIGQDIVNHCVNDILVQGAKPLFFLDYIGAARFDAEIFNNVIKGLCQACKQNNCALLGGETAEMPGLYPLGEYDLVGTIIGTVKKSKVITGEKIRPGDVVIGLPSGGLQTNGYSLARKVIFDKCGHGLQDIFPGTKSTVTQILLAVHKSFLKPVTALMDAKIPIPGMAHITGGGFYDNIPRVLPDNCDAEIDRSSWSVPPVFTFIEREGKVDHDEMYRVFNMGIGYTIIVRPKDVDATMKILKKMRQAPLVIGKITKGKKVVTCIN